MAARILLIAAFGAFGSVLRYFVSLAAGQLSAPLGRALRAAPEITLPLGTLLCNVTGSLAIGCLGYWFAQRNSPENVRAALVVGLLGGYTTFSAFAFDTWTLAQRGQFRLAILNFVLNNILSLLAVWAGYRATERLVG